MGRKRDVSNINFAQDTNGYINIHTLPHVNFFTTNFNIPGLSITPASQETPFSELKFPGDTVAFDTFNINFVLDEDMKNWIEIFSWMKGIAFPESYNEYKNWVESNLADNPLALAHVNENGAIYSDITFIMNTNHNTYNREFRFTDCFPVSLSSLEFVHTSPETEKITCAASFAFQTMNVVN